MNYKILQGDNRTTLKTLADNSIDAIVTDPPYGIDFLGKSWDANTGALETYQECLRVLKPGGHILAFSAARTYHHLAITLEQAGFEIRDQIMWIYSSGFPKSQDIGKSIDRQSGKADPNYTGSKKKGHNLAYGSAPVGGRPCGKCGKDDTHQYICEDTECGLKYKPQTEAGKQWAGWGTALKPAHEPICLARKPIKLSIAKNCQQWGVGALNIDATRIPYSGPEDKPVPHGGKARQSSNPGWMSTTGHNIIENPEINAIGRFPSNVIGEIPLYQKYFYCPKVGRRERHIGFDTKEGPVTTGGMWDTDGTGVQYNASKTIKTHWEMAEEMGGSLVDHEGNPTRSGNKALLPDIGEIYTHGLAKHYADWCKQNNKPMPYVGNNHPTVKPIELMKYLIKLITPPGGTVLDPFNGSGSTGCAAVELGHTYIGCELDQRYVDITQKRIEAWHKQVNPTTFGTLFTTE